MGFTTIRNILIIAIIFVNINYLHAQISEQLQNKIRSSVVQIVTDDGNGTGFFVGDYGCIITNQHVLDKSEIGDEIIIQARNIKNEQVQLKGFYCSSIKNHDMNIDLAIIGIPNYEKHYKNQFNGIEFSKDLPKIGDKTVIAGFPLGKAFPSITVLNAEIVSLDDDGTYRLASFSEPGNSGSPVLDRKGNCLGVIYASHRGTKINYVMGLKDIEKGLDDLMEPYMPKGNIKISLSDKLKFQTLWNVGNLLQLNNDFNTSIAYIKGALSIVNSPPISLLEAKYILKTEPNSFSKAVNVMLSSFDQLKASSTSDILFVKWKTMLDEIIFQSPELFKNISDYESFINQLESIYSSANARNKAFNKYLQFIVSKVIMSSHFKNNDRETGLKWSRNATNSIQNAIENVSSNPIYSLTAVEQLIAVDEMDEAWKVIRKYSTQTNNQDFDFFRVVLNKYFENGSYWQCRANYDNAKKNYEYCHRLFVDFEKVFNENKPRQSPETIAEVYRSVAFARTAGGANTSFGDDAALVDSAISYEPTNYKNHWLKGYITYNRIKGFKNNFNKSYQEWDANNLNTLLFQLINDLEESYQLAYALAGYNNETASMINKIYSNLNVIFREEPVKYNSIWESDFNAVSYKELSPFKYKSIILFQYITILMDLEFPNALSIAKARIISNNIEINNEFASNCFDILLYYYTEGQDKTKGKYNDFIMNIELDSDDNMRLDQFPWWRGFGQELYQVIY